MSFFVSIEGFHGSVFHTDKNKSEELVAILISAGYDVRVNGIPYFLNYDTGFAHPTNFPLTTN